MRILLILLFILAITAAALSVTCESPTQADLEDVQTLHRGLDPASIPRLRDIISESNDDYVRERAVFALADIAIRAEQPDEAIPFLKALAIDERADPVRAAAYANLGLIREFYPVDLQGDLSLRLEGEIKQGEVVTLVATVTAGAPSTKVTVGIKRIVHKEKTRGRIQHVDRAASSRDMLLGAGETQEVSFDLMLEESGAFAILVAAKFDMDRVEYELVEKELHLSFGEVSGTYMAY